MLHLSKIKLLCSGHKEWTNGENAATLFAFDEGDNYVVYLESNETHDNFFYIDFGSGPSAYYLACEFFEAVVSYLHVVIHNFKTALPFAEIVGDANFLSSGWTSLSLDKEQESVVTSELSKITSLIDLYRKA